MLDSVLDYYISRDQRGWECIAALDESRDYEIDVTEVFRTPTGFAIVTASGCSCWSGEYDVTYYATMQEVVDALRFGDQPSFNPSVKGAAELISQLQADS